MRRKDISKDFRDNILRKPIDGGSLDQHKRCERYLIQILHSHLWVPTSIDLDNMRGATVKAELANRGHWA
jgi:hypothetical protein